MITSTCSVDGCERPRKARGWCHFHWQRWRKHGDPGEAGPRKPGSRGCIACSVPDCTAPHFAHGFCRTHYRHWRTHGDPSVGGRRSLEARFWAKVARRATGCWLWTDRPNSNGYGQIKVNGTKQSVHRVSYALAHGSIPAGLWVCHHCDRRLCVRPDHLFLGTRADDTADMVAKGRQSRHERHYASKLTRVAVADIRARWSHGGISMTSLAAEYGVSRATLSAIVRGLKWRGLPPS